MLNALLLLKRDSSARTPSKDKAIVHLGQVLIGNDGVEKDICLQLTKYINPSFYALDFCYQTVH